MSETNRAPSSIGDTLKALHHQDQILMLPNIWDPLGAALLEDLGFRAVATASASLALSQGFPDGEKIPFRLVTETFKRICAAVRIPVTADIESGYTCNDHILSENIKKLLDTGIAGINIEETCHETGVLFSIEAQCKRIALVRKAATEMGVNLFITARTDVYLRPNQFPGDQLVEEAIRRGKAFRDAGADGFYPILLKDSDAIERMIKEVNLPLNIILLPGTPDFDQLKALGVARISLGPGFLSMAIASMKNMAEKLLHHDGMNDIKQNPITASYLNKLISTKRTGKNR